MNFNEICGKRQLEFMKGFDYIREAGTDGEKLAAQAIVKELNTFGVEGKIEEFPIELWQEVKAEFTVTEPYRKSYSVAAYCRCGDTPDEGIEAEFLYAENGDDINLSYAEGKIVMVNGPVYQPEMYEKLVKSGAVAFLSVSGTPIDEGEDLKVFSRNAPKVEVTPIQGVIIHHRDAMEIIDGGVTKAKIAVRSEKVDLICRNVVATIPGSDLADEVITLTGHFDTVPQGPGAYDNMAAGAIIMELCRYFKEHPTRRTLEFVWFGGEEKGLLGSRNYVTTRKDSLKNHKFNLNVDLAGQAVGGTVIGITGDKSICGVIENIAKDAGIGMVTRHAIWGSDSNAFAWNGVPALTVNRDGFGMHTRHDRVDYISHWSLGRSAKLLGAIAENFASCDEMPFPREIPEQFRQELDAYFAKF